MKLFFNRFSLYFAWLVAMIATFCSLYASQIMNYEPCVFCWYQRMMMFPLVIILGIATYKKDRKIIIYVIAFPVIGAFIALIQTLFSYFNFSSSICGSDCTDEKIKLFGLIDYSIASFFSFLSIGFLLIFSKNKKH